MGFLGIFKKKESNKVAWRNAQGMINCSGDNCSSECDENCPIWLNSIGLQMLLKGRYENGIQAFNDAISLAPDFVEAQNNVGSAYGLVGRHEEAYQAFKKALEMKPGYLEALTGLVVSETKLEMYEDALEHCDDIEHLGGDTEQLRKNIYEGMRSKEEKNKIDYLELTKVLLDNGRKAGFIQSENFAHIPEIVVRAEDVCKKIIVAMQKYAEENPDEEDSGLMQFSSTLAWACYAGIGAVYHWNNDWGALATKGIYETLASERGILEMDEYVMDVIGFGYGTEKERNLTKFITEQTGECMLQIAANLSMENYIMCTKAMYLFGMIFEMNQLGMM